MLRRGDLQMQPVRGVLLDIDGVLHISMQPIAGAAEAVKWLERHGYPICFVTNTTTYGTRYAGRTFKGYWLAH